LIDFESLLTDEERLVAETVRTFVRDRVRPNIASGSRRRLAR